MDARDFASALHKLGRVATGDCRVVSDGERLFLYSGSRHFDVRVAFNVRLPTFDVWVAYSDLRRAVRKMSGEMSIVFRRGFFEVRAGRRARVVPWTEAQADCLLFDISDGCSSVLCGATGAFFQQVQVAIVGFHKAAGEVLDLTLSSRGERSIEMSSSYCTARLIVERVYGGFSVRVSPYLFLKAMGVAHRDSGNLVLNIGGGALYITQLSQGFEFTIAIVLRGDDGVS